MAVPASDFAFANHGFAARLLFCRSRAGDLYDGFGLVGLACTSFLVSFAEEFCGRIATPPNAPLMVLEICWSLGKNSAVSSHHQGMIKRYSYAISSAGRCLQRDPC